MDNWFGKEDGGQDEWSLQGAEGQRCYWGGGNTWKSGGNDSPVLGWKDCLKSKF